ncbi:hypothetical protein JWV37_01985 [Sulfurospirillum sp. T05]|uniref:POTRA domain-containing protein n=1 Tax=Sulfurospirillum tamanense TaxID=2813362 RepID=A0ABS2WPH0_9BACT|nr:POTRA domain-containing protein [Sulfurospirillum tamanensis]MBN2963535.1 hypothetical protein [Sulfurospirillum tamanensis]
MALHVKNNWERIVPFSLIAASMLLAQTPPSTGDILRQVEPPKIVEPKRSDDVPVVTLPEILEETKPSTVESAVGPVGPSSLKATSTPTIQGFAFVGNDSVDDASLQEALASFVGQPLTPVIIAAAEEAATVFYQSKGFKKAKAYAFSDAIHKGTITLAIRARNHETLANDPKRVTSTMPQSVLEKAFYPGVLVKAFAFEGNEAITAKELHTQVSIHEGRTLSTKELLGVADTIIAYYRSRGFKNARAYLFKDNITDDGIVTYTIDTKDHQTHEKNPNRIHPSDTFPFATIPIAKTPERVSKPPVQQPVAPEAPKVKASEPSALINTFVFSGNTTIPSSELESLVVSYAGKTLSLSQLEEITSLITRRYRAKGYFVARAYIPTQVIEENKVEIAIIEGRYGEFYITNNSLVNDTLIQGMMDDIKGKDSISTDTLERAMLLINDTPGATITQADVKPGKHIGTSDFVITASPSSRYNGYILADNHGSPYTGENRLMGGFSINSPFGWGDKLSLNGLISDDTNLDNARIAYGFPLYFSGTRGELSYSRTTYSLGDIYKPLDAVGLSEGVTFEISHPLIRSRKENLSLFANLSAKKIEDKIRSTDTITKKSATTGSFGLRYDKSTLFLSKEANYNASFSFTAGDLDYKDAAQDTANTQGSYQKLNLELSQSLLLSPLWMWNNTLRAQYALSNKNLDGSEDFSVGGNGGVRAYPDGELSAENGYVYTTELRYSLPMLKGISHQVGVFYGIGRTYMSDNTVGFEAKTLQNAGVSYYVSYRDFFLHTHLASRIDSKKVESEDNYRTRFFVQGGWVF